MKVVIADDQNIFCKGLAHLLEGLPFDTIAIEAVDLKGLVDALNANATADIALVAVPLPGLVSLHGLKPLRDQFPLTRFAIMSSDESRDQMLRVLAAGLHGFISKRQPDVQIMSAIRDILSGRIYVPQSIADGDAPTTASAFRMAGDGRGVADASSLRLTKRQQDVLELIAEGCSNKEIARKLSLAEATVKIHATAMMRSLGVRNRTEAALIARGH